MSVMTRGLVEVFSVILLYQKGFSLTNIYLFLFIMYLSGIFVNYFSLRFSYKFVMILSALLYGGSYLYLSYMESSFINLIIFAFLLAFSSYSFHAIRHYLAMKMIDYDKGKNINLLLVVNYLAVTFSSLIGALLIEKLDVVVTSLIIIVFSLLSIIPIWGMEDIKRERLDLKKVKIEKDKFVFSILEQFKVLFLELQPIYLYLYVEKSVYYVGIFNVIINLASLVVMIFISRKIQNRHFRYVNIMLGVVLVLKINISNSLWLLLVAFLEGIFVKLYEKFSLNNLYDFDYQVISSYLLYEEFIFFGAKSVFMLLFFLFIKDIRMILYFCIVGLVFSGFYIKDKK